MGVQTSWIEHICCGWETVLRCSKVISMRISCLIVVLTSVGDRCEESNATLFLSLDIEIVRNQNIWGDWEVAAWFQGVVRITTVCEINYYYQHYYYYYIILGWWRCWQCGVMHHKSIVHRSADILIGFLISVFSKPIYLYTRLSSS